MSNAFEAGQFAYRSGKAESDNPYLIGKTKLGNPKFSDSELGADWHNGWLSAKPARICSKAENEAAASVDVKRFGRKSNRYYQFRSSMY